MLTEIDNKISDSTMFIVSQSQNNMKDVTFLEERNKYFNDWACFLMTHFTHKYIEKLIKTIVISKSNEDSTVDIYIKRLLLKPSNTREFKKYFEYFFDSLEKINEYYINIVKYVIYDIYNIYIEALNLYENEINECIEFEKEGLSYLDILEKNKEYKNSHTNIFYDSFKHEKSYENDPFIKDEINQAILYSDKIKCVYRFLIKKMSIQFFKILGFFYKNNFLKEDIIKIIMKNNFKYTSIKFMKEFIKYSNIKWNDDCSHHKDMIISFKKKFESKLKTCSSMTKFCYEELFKIYNNIDIQLIKDDSLLFSPKKSNSYFIPIIPSIQLSRKPSFSISDHINELRIGTETPLFNKEILFSPISPSPSSFTLNDLNNNDLVIDYNLLKLMNNIDDSKILNYINKIMSENNELLSSEIVIITFLHSLENYRIDELSNIIDLVSKINYKIKINKDIIDSIFNKYTELEDELKIDNPLLVNKLNVIFS